MSKYYELKYMSFSRDLESALMDYYGDITVHYNNDNDPFAKIIIFSCPTVCDKIIKIKVRKKTEGSQITYISAWVGSSYVGGENISNSTAILDKQDYQNPTDDNFTNIGVLLSLNFIYIGVVYPGSSSHNSSFVLFAQCTNSKYLCSGLTGFVGCPESHSYYTDDLSTNLDLHFVSLGSESLKSGNQILISPSYFANGSNLELDDDGSLAYIEGLFVTSFKTPYLTIGSNYFISFAPMYSGNGNGQFMSSGFYTDIEE